MKPRLLLFALSLTVLADLTLHYSVRAQEKRHDATGGVIPCPPADEPAGEEEEEKKSTVTPLPPTATPLPIAVSGQGNPLDTKEAACNDSP
jgi:hypothetical protein